MSAATDLLSVLASLCTEIASGLNNALSVLRYNAEDPNAAHLACDAMERLGWLADRAAGLAGGVIPVAGDGWLLQGHEDRIKELEAAELEAAESTSAGAATAHLTVIDGGLHA